MQGHEEAERAPPVGHDVRHLEVDARGVVADAEQHAFRVDVQSVADGEVLLLHDGDLGGLFKVVPEHAAAQADVEVGEDACRLLEGMLQRSGIHIVLHGGCVAEHRLGRAARLGRVELADVV